MRKIVVRKSDKKVVSFGDEDISRFNPQEFDTIQTNLANLPDELRFCKYENGLVIVDEIDKQQILQQEAQRQQNTKNAREYIEKNNPADVNSVPALRERVKRLEVLLGIHKWL